MTEEPMPPGETPPETSADPLTKRDRRDLEQRIGASVGNTPGVDNDAILESELRRAGHWGSRVARDSARRHMARRLERERLASEAYERELREDVQSGRLKLPREGERLTPRERAALVLGLFDAGERAKEGRTQ